MGFTVSHPNGTKESEFQEYARLLRKRGVDLGKAPRVREPETDRRWLYVWDTEKEARAFADELKKHTRDAAWSVVKVNGPASEGPLGPVVIQMVRQGDRLTLGLHPLSQVMIRSAFPDAVGAISYAIVTTTTWSDFKKIKGGLGDLVREIVPGLTGLSLSQLESLGYSVVDADTDETLVSVPPAVAAPA
jgi:hypothetical protein